MASSGAGVTAAGKNKLTDSPTNLKEAIDWILRVTNKDGQEELKDTTKHNCLCPLSQAVVTVLRDVQVKDYLDHREEKTLVSEILSKIDTIGGVRTTRNLIEEVASKLADLIGYRERKISTFIGEPIGNSKLTINGIGCPGKTCSHNNGVSCKGYQSSYGKDANFEKLKQENGTTSGSDSGKDSWTTLAKIFLGAIPLVFSGLSFMYWYSIRASNNTVNAENYLLCHYMKRMGYDTSKLKCGEPEEGTSTENTKRSNGGQNYPEDGINGQELHEIMENNDLFKGFKDVKDISFAQYLEKVREEVKKTPSGGRTTEHALLKLNTLSTGYFRALNQPYRVHQRKPRLPRTIREILYWLSCVQYCPVFRVLVQKLRDLCERNGKTVKFVAIKDDKEKKCEIDSSNCISYFLSAALVAPMVLLSIQDTIQSRVGHLDRKSNTKAAKLASHEMTYEEKIEKILEAGGNQVYIHDLYSNSLFEFRFPMSETESYYLLQDCLVALYYQMYFLKQQCNWNRQSTEGDGFGWAFCRYGDGVNSTDCVSWICPQAKAASSTDGESTNYANTLKEHTGQCGKNGTSGASNPSPLQAFLTDCLPGFTCEKVVKKMKSLGITGNRSKDEISNNYQKCYMEFLEHRNHILDKPDQYCPIPMGFTGCFKGSGSGSATTGVPGVGGAGMSGLAINAITSHYANDDLRDSCLYQLTRCICSLTRRVPRSTGTLYGFFQGIIGVYGSGGGATGQKGGTATFKDSLEEELQLVTFGWRKPDYLMGALMEWKGTKGKHSTSGDCSCLDSLSNCDQSPTCGKYLHPLTGSLYNSVATQYTDTYLSWILYLSGRLQDGLRELLDAFSDIDCSKSGCVKTENGVISTGTSGGTTPCECTKNGCTKGKHGTTPSSTTPNSTGCCCHSVVHCAGVYSVFYRYGFSIHSPFGLSGRKVTKDKESYDNASKRTCNDFYKQLQIVIRGGLFKKVESCIRAFLYTTRLPFGLVIFGFWSIVLVYLLWSMTVNLDLIHIQSHWKSPGSYLVPLQRILADGSRKGFCTLGYFREGTGNGLLEQGVSDVYL